MKSEKYMKMKRNLLFFLCLLPLLLTSCFPTPEEETGPSFQMIAIVENLSEPFSVNVIEAEYAEGIYWLVTDNDTIYLDAKGNTIRKSDISVGDTIEITYNGQVMLSYPPQVSARKIVKK